jgi:prefoldin subunit 5
VEERESQTQRELRELEQRLQRLQQEAAEVERKLAEVKRTIARLSAGEDDDEITGRSRDDE